MILESEAKKVLRGKFFVDTIRKASEKNYYKDCNSGRGQSLPSPLFVQPTLFLSNCMRVSMKDTYSPVFRSNKNRR
jgi:hypothetical protein